MSIRDVDFVLNKSLKENIQLEKKSREVTVKELKDVNPFLSREKFGIIAKVIFGKALLEDINTHFGTTQSKRDLYVEDLKGTMNKQMFADRLKEVTSNGFYMPQQFRGDI